MSNDEKIAEFVCITGASAEEAEHLLEATDWEVSAAVQLHFDGGANLEQDSEMLAHRLATGDAGPSTRNEDVSDPRAEADAVRRPDEVRLERLFDGPQSSRMPYGMGYGRAMPPVVDMPTRNFRAEAEAFDTSHTLPDIYKPPADLMDDTPLAQMKTEAETADKWMLINIQSQDEFASHQLNADLWGHPMIKDIVKSNFHFAQRTVPDEEAQSVVQTYDLQQLPAVIILDPHTAQKMIQWTGLIQPDRFLEEIMAFLEIPPSDPRAGQLMHSALKQTTFQSSAPPVMGSAGVLGLSDEDEIMARAITASLQSSQHQPAANGNAHASAFMDIPDDDDEDDDYLLGQIAAFEASTSDAAPAGVAPSKREPYVIDDDSDSPVAAGPSTSPAVAAVSVEELQAQAAARLPAEPGAGSPGSCRVAIRMPNNERAMRLFMTDDPVSALYDFALSKLGAEVAHQPFKLWDASPGGPALDDRAASLKEANAAGTMLQLKWV